MTLLTLYVFFLMAIPSRYTFGPLGGAGAPSTVLGAVLFLGYLFYWLHPSSRIDKGPQPVRRAGVVFLCAVLAAYIAANLHKLPALEMNGADRGIIMTCGWLGIMLVAADSITTLDRLKTLIRRIVFGATAMAILGMTQFFTGFDLAKYIVVPGLIANQPYTDISTRGTVNRPAATAIHPIEFGFVLAMVLPLAIHQARYAPPGLRFRRWLQVALIAATLPMTVSRSAILGLAVGLIVILPTWPRRERWVAYVAGIFGLAVLRTVIPGLIGTLRTLFLELGSGSDTSTQSRTAAFGHAAPLLSAHPLFGQGFGTFLPYTLFYTDDQYLNSLIEIGAVGLVSLIAMFITAWVVTRRARRLTTDPELRHLCECLAACAAVALITYATFDALYFPMAAGLTFLVLGCAGAAYRLVRNTSRRYVTMPEPVPALVQQN